MVTLTMSGASVVWRGAGAESGPAVHIAPGAVVHIGGLTITNSILYGWISMLLMIIVLVTSARLVTVRPRRGLVQLIEIGVEFMERTVEAGFFDKARAHKYVPFFVTLFFFMLLNNWLGLMPGVGEALNVGGTPLLRPFTADLNGTLAAAVVTMLYVYTSSIREAGSVGRYLRHFFIGNPANPLYFAIGLLEMVTDLTRVLSLSLRLFLNVAVGEMIIAVFSYLGNAAAPLAAAPFTILELFVGALQAYIFATLGAMYVAIAVNLVDHAQNINNAAPSGAVARKVVVPVGHA